MIENICGVRVPPQPSQHSRARYRIRHVIRDGAHLVDSRDGDGLTDRPEVRAAQALACATCRRTESMRRQSSGPCPWNSYTSNVLGWTPWVLCADTAAAGQEVVLRG
jgi:hypothetical protein